VAFGKQDVELGLLVGDVLGAMLLVGGA